MPAGAAFLAHVGAGGAPTASLLAVPAGDRRVATGRGCSPRRPGPPSRRAAEPSSSCPTTATSCASRRRCSTCWGRGGTPGSPPTRGRRRGTPRTSRRCAATRRSSSAPGPPASRRSATSGSSPGGTTATTSSRSRGRPTRTCARCSSRGRGVTGAAVLSAGFTRSVAVADLAARGVLTAVEADRRRGAARGAPRPGRRRGPRRRPRPGGRGGAPARPSPGAPRRRRSSAVRSSCRCRGAATSPRCPARTAAGPPGARCAPGRSALSGPQGPPACRWCGRVETGFTCPACGGHRLRSSVVGARRTAEELGRAFPGVPVERSGAGTVLDAVAAGPRLVVSTPGAEPVAPGGYAAALLLDAWALLERPSLTAGEESLRRWLAAAALVRPPSADGGRVVLCPARRPTCRCRRSRRSCGGTPRGSPRASSRSGASCPCRRRHPSPRSPGPRPALEAAAARARPAAHGRRPRAAAARGHRALAHAHHRRPAPRHPRSPASWRPCAPGPRRARTPTPCRCGSTPRTPRPDRAAHPRHLDSRA